MNCATLSDTDHPRGENGPKRQGGDMGMGSKMMAASSRYNGKTPVQGEQAFNNRLVDIGRDPIQF